MRNRAQWPWWLSPREVRAPETFWSGVALWREAHAMLAQAVWPWSPGGDR